MLGTKAILRKKNCSARRSKKSGRGWWAGDRDTRDLWNMMEEKTGEKVGFQWVFLNSLHGFWLVQGYELFWNSVGG